MIKIWERLGAPAKAAFGWSIALSALAAVSGVVLIGLSGWFLTASALAGFAGAGMAFNHLYPSAGVRLAAFARVSARYGEQIVGHDAILRLSSALRPNLFERGARARRGMGAMASGELSALVDDVEAVEGGFLRIVLPALAIAASAILAVCLAFMADVTTGVSALAAFLLVVLGLPYRAARRSRALAHTHAAENERARAEVSRLVENAAELDVIGALPALCTESGALLLQQQTGLLQIERPFRGLGALIAFAGAALGVLCLVRADAQNVALATGAALALIAAFESAGAMAKVLDAAPRAAAASRRLSARLDAPSVPAEPHAAASLEAVLPLQARGLVVAAADDAIEIAIPDFTLNAGMLLEVTGRSGSGKTTLAEMLMHLQPVRSGDLIYADHAFDTVRTPAVLERIAMSPQLTDFLPRSLREQLLLANPEATDAAIMEALDTACVGDVVRGRPSGLDSLFDSEGAGFSGGELRRIGLARALVCEPEVLILDEPFAGLEPVLTARLIENLVRWTMNGRRALVVLRHEADLQVWPHLERKTIAMPAARD